MVERMYLALSEWWLVTEANRLLAAVELNNQFPQDINANKDFRSWCYWAKIDLARFSGCVSRDNVVICQERYKELIFWFSKCQLYNWEVFSIMVTIGDSRRFTVPVVYHVVAEDSHPFDKEVVSLSGQIDIAIGACIENEARVCEPRVHPYRSWNRPVFECASHWDVQHWAIAVD